MKKKPKQTATCETCSKELKTREGHIYDKCLKELYDES